MNKRACGLLLLALPYLLGIDLLRASNKNVAQGNAKLLKGDAQSALDLYDKALAEDGLSDQEERAAAEFNRGAALSALNKNDEASQAFLEATKSKDASLRARAFYNLGNTFFRGEKFSEAVEAYKRSLVLDPKTPDSKWNLELALRRKREEEKKKEEQDKNKQDKNDQDKNKQDKNDQDKNKQDKNDQDKNDQDKNNPDKGDPKQDPQKQDFEDDKGGQQDPKEKESDKSEQDKNEGAENQDQGQPKDSEQEKPGEKPQAQEPSPKPEDKPNQQPAAPSPAQEQPGEGQSGPKNGSPDMKEINAILDSLEQSPQEIERQRARMRAVRRRPPVKDW